MSTDINTIAKALFIVNRHAKTAPDPKELYQLKKQTIEKLLKENRAKKLGLHFSEHPKFSHQHSTLLVNVGEYYFHIPPTKEDFKSMKHLGELDKNFRNPKPQMPLSQAKKILCNYLGKTLTKQNNTNYQKKSYSSYYIPSSLGKISRPSYKKRDW